MSLTKQAAYHRMDEPLSWAVKRRLIEVLVAGVRVDTVDEMSLAQACSAG